MLCSCCVLQAAHKVLYTWIYFCPLNEICLFSTSFLPFSSPSDTMSLGGSGYAATCTFRKRATTLCLGLKKEQCTSSGFVPLTRLESDAPPRPLNPSSLETLWNTPGLRVIHNLSLWEMHIYLNMFGTVQVGVYCSVYLYVYLPHWRP